MEEIPIRQPPSELIQRLRGRIYFIEVVIIPLVLFGIDAVYRASLGIEVADAGADMCLLAASAMIANIVEDFTRGDRANVVLALFLFLFSLGCWTGSLKLLSIGQWPVGIRGFIVIGMGVSLLVITSYFSYQFDVVREWLSGERSSV